MRNSGINRRNFLLHASGMAVSTRLFKTFNAVDTKYVIAETRFGKIRVIEKRGIKIFNGVSYGADMGGKNRFITPKDPAAWSGVQNVLQYGHSAPQSRFSWIN